MHKEDPGFPSTFFPVFPSHTLVLWVTCKFYAAALTLIPFGFSEVADADLSLYRGSTPE